MLQRPSLHDALIQYARPSEHVPLGTFLWARPSGHVPLGTSLCPLSCKEHVQRDVPRGTCPEGRAQRDVPRGTCPEGRAHPPFSPEGREMAWHGEGTGRRSQFPSRFTALAGIYSGCHCWPSEPGQDSHC